MDDARRITAAIASGDTGAFACLYEAKFAYMLAVVRRATRLDEEACLDIVQDAMMKAIRSMKPISTEVELDRWLARVARTVAYDHLRSMRRRRVRERASIRNEAPPETAMGDAQLAERAAWLREQLGALDRVTAEIIDLRHRAGLTLDAIGRRLGMKTGAVHGRLTRGVEKLRTAAQEDDRD